MADGEGFPRTMLTHRLRGNRDDLTALHWSNLLVVEQGFSSAPPIHKIKTPRWGRVYFMAVWQDSTVYYIQQGIYREILAIFEQKPLLLHAQDVHSPVLAKHSLNK